MHLCIYTDGGCSGNPGPGGWAYVIIGSEEKGKKKPKVSRMIPGELFPREGSGELIREKWGAERNTTNNRMELYAAVAALEALTKLDLSPETVTVYTDSQYVQKGMTEWIKSWKQNGWRTSDRKPVKNQELWLRLDELAPNFAVKWQWVRGHAGNEFNERCDQMTQEAIASLKKRR
ncbi:ribonuclease H family protein [Treponema primitia]|uniref:ribonuclease H family protein n=1 Tax=Treponema primitia TaxID=88058 RepID=UPI00025550BE|nr:ribonuclease H [Treponema primitia]